MKKSITYLLLTQAIVTVFAIATNASIYSMMFLYAIQTALWFLVTTGRRVLSKVGVIYKLFAIANMLVFVPMESNQSKKEKNWATINSSYTLFYLIITVGVTFVFANSLPTLKGVSFFILLLYALLVYFMWDFVRQLYNPTHALFLILLTIVGLPFFMNMLFGFPYGRAGAYIFIISTILAAIPEFIYEVLVKRHLSKRFFRRMFLVDKVLDKHFIKLREEHLLLTDARGMAGINSFSSASDILVYYHKNAF